MSEVRREPGVWRRLFVQHHFAPGDPSADGCLANEVKVVFGDGLADTVFCEDAQSRERYGRRYALFDVRENPMVTTAKDAAKMGQAVLRDLAWPVTDAIEQAKRELGEARARLEDALATCREKEARLARVRGDPQRPPSSLALRYYQGEDAP